MIRVSFLSRPIPESIPECTEYILVTLRSAVLKFRINAFRIGETGGFAQGQSCSKDDLR